MSEEKPKEHLTRRRTEADPEAKAESQFFYSLGRQPPEKTKRKSPQSVNTDQPTDIETASGDELAMSTSTTTAPTSMLISTTISTTTSTTTVKPEPVQHDFKPIEVKPVSVVKLDSYTQTSIKTTEISDKMASSDPLTLDSLKTVMAGSAKKKTGVEVRPFSGTTTENAKAWLSQFNDYCELCEVTTDKERKLTFGLLLKGTALLWYTELDSSIKAEWFKIQTAFTSTYVDDKWISRYKLETLQAKDFKTAEQYVNHATTLAGSAGVQSDGLITYLIRGLPDTWKVHVIPQDPQTIQECIKKIYMAESMVKLTEGAPVKAVSTDPQRDVINKIAAGVKFLKSSRSQSRNFRGQSGQSGRGNGPLLCYTCYKTGHTSSHCWFNPANNNRGRGRGGWSNRNNNNNTNNSSNNNNGNNKDSGDITIHLCHRQSSDSSSIQLCQLIQK